MTVAAHQAADESTEDVADAIAVAPPRPWAGLLLAGCVALQSVGLAFVIDAPGSIRAFVGALGLLLAVGLHALWSRGVPSFARDMVLITTAIGGLGMLLGSAVDGDHAAHAAHGQTGHGHAALGHTEHVAMAHEMDEAAHASAHHGHAMAVASDPAMGEPGEPATPRDGEASAWIEMASHWTAAPGMTLGMLAFCVPGCWLLCRPCSLRSSTWRRTAHGACLVGMMVGMALGGTWAWPEALSWAPTALGSVADHHLRMLAGMALGTGVVAALATRWPMVAVRRPVAR